MTQASLKSLIHMDPTSLHKHVHVSVIKSKSMLGTEIVTNSLTCAMS